MDHYNCAESFYRELYLYYFDLNNLKCFAVLSNVSIAAASHDAKENLE